ncbi:factor associated with metabolism and energy-like [Chiloscyllium punctatum]|uniref:factor associated with metabolism and energy-like n=1 Tax=Chiloscyllium punctatum TaxID=137246 RepID=UPI003B63BEBD
MGSGWSRGQHKLIRVRPVPACQAGICPGVQRHGSRRTSCSLVAAGDWLTHGHLKAASLLGRSELPPLKEVRNGSRPLPSLRQIPHAFSFESPLDDGERSIIKKHPPRKLEKLEPINCGTVITSEKSEGRQRACKTQAQEVQAEIANQFSRRRQQIQKIQYEKQRRQQEAIHLQEQTELKRNLALETGNSNEKIKDVGAKKAREAAQNNSHQDQCYIAIAHDETFSKDDDNPWNDFISPMLFINDNADNNNHFRISKQFMKNPTTWNNSSNSSSNDSLAYWMDNTRQSRRSLMRTKTERILVFDDFFDQEL